MSCINHVNGVHADRGNSKHVVFQAWKAGVDQLLLCTGNQIPITRQFHINTYTQTF